MDNKRVKILNLIQKLERPTDIEIDREMERGLGQYRWTVFVRVLRLRGYPEACKRVNRTLTYIEHNERVRRAMASVFGRITRDLQVGMKQFAAGMKRWNEKQKIQIMKVK